VSQIPDTIERAILERTSPHSREAQLMKEQAFALLRDGMNEEDVAQVFQHCPDMVLKREHLLNGKYLLVQKGRKNYYVITAA